jgi:hypothetical protein
MAEVLADEAFEGRFERTLFDPPEGSDAFSDADRACNPRGNNCATPYTASASTAIFQRAGVVITSTAAE